ncbi:MAG: Fic family protein [Alphaproteobacteria bacterium]|nr:Fic family protein [Alphaproteobacteria bacterium]
MTERHSQADDANLIADPIARAEKETANGLLQYDAGLRIIEDFVKQPTRPFRLRPSILLHLHRVALEGLSSFAGNYRPAGVTIGGSRHTPPGAHLVPELVENLCDYVNDQWNTATAVHLSAFVMWRLNWIHPFADGNGRTSRAASYVVLCIRSNFVLPGVRTIPDQITENRDPYFRALDVADAADREGRLDVTEMEALIEVLLARQLAEAMRRATGKPLE